MKKNLNPLFEGLFDHPTGQGKDIENIGITAATTAYGLQGLGRVLASDNIPQSVKTNMAIVHGTAYILNFIQGVLRSKKHKMVFDKIKAKFPTSKSMYDYLYSRGLQIKGLTDNLNETEYNYWICKNIVKRGSFWRIFGNFFFGALTVPYHLINKSSLEDRTAEDIISDRMS